MEPVSPNVKYGTTEAEAFALRLFIAPEQCVPGAALGQILERFSDSLVLPGYALQTLYSRTPGVAIKPNTGPFSDRRWSQMLRRVREGEIGVIGCEVRDPPLRSGIALSIIANPEKSDGPHVCGSISVECDLSYLLALRSFQRVSDLISFGSAAWVSAGTGGVYGYANLGVGSARRNARPWEVSRKATPIEHPIPVALVGSSVDSDLCPWICKGAGIKGAFWSNFLNDGYLRRVGGINVLRQQLPAVRIEALGSGGLMVLASEDPIPEDTEPNRMLYMQLCRALRPAFIPRGELPEHLQYKLGQFYLEREI